MRAHLPLSMQATVTGGFMAGPSEIGDAIPKMHHRWRAAIRWLCFVAAFTSTLAALQARYGRSVEGDLRRDAVRGFAENSQGANRYPVFRAVRLVHAITKHGDDRTISVSENWVQWCLGKIYSPLQRSQDADCILERGIGDCSERVAVLQWLFRESRLPTRIVGLGGHVVIEVFANGMWYTVDPDYGVLYFGDTHSLAKDSDERLARPLVRQGYAPDVVRTYVEIVKSTDDNITMPLNSPLSPRLHWVEELSRYILFALPWMLWAVVGLQTWSRFASRRLDV